MSDETIKINNRRRVPRRAPKRNTKLTCQKGTMGLGPNIAVSLLDLSEAGARLIVKAPVAPGEEVELGFMASAQSKPTKMVADVVWAVMTLERQYCIGARFQRQLSWAEWQELI